MNELLVLFGYPSSLPLGVFRLVVMFMGLIVEFAGVEDVPWIGHVGRDLLPGLAGGSRILCGGSGRILGGVERVQLHRKTPAHLARYTRDGGYQSRPKVWKRLRLSEGPRFRHFGAKVPRLHQGDEAHGSLDRVGVG